MSEDTKPVSYKTLPAELKRQGYIYKQLVRVGKWAIYGQYCKKPSRLAAYEVVKIGRHNGFSIAGMCFPPAETYPSSSMWGSHGWTYSSLEAAKKSFSDKLSAEAGGEPDEILRDMSILNEMFRESEGDPSSI